MEVITVRYHLLRQPPLYLEPAPLFLRPGVYSEVIENDDELSSSSQAHPTTR